MKTTDSSSAISLRRAAALLPLTVVLAPLIAGGFDLYPQSMLGALLLFTGALLLAARRLAGRQDRLATPADRPVALLVAAAFLSLLVSVNRHASIVELLRLLSEVAAFAVAVSAGAQWADAPTAAEAEPEPVAARPAEAPAALQKAQTPSVKAHKKARRERARPEPAAEPAAPRAPLRLPHFSQVTWLWAAILAGTTWAGALAVREYVRTMHDQSTWRSFGGFSHPNTLAGHLALTLPLFLAAAIALHDRKDALGGAWPVPAALFLLCSFGLITTSSRMGILAAGFGLLLFALLVLAQRRRVTPVQIVLVSGVLILAGVGAAFAVPTLRLRIMAALSGAEGFSLGFRVASWEAALRIFGAHPIAGIGIGTFGSIVTKYSDAGFVQEAHNHLAQTAAETGIGGLAGLVALLAVWFAAVGRGLRQARGAQGDSGGGTARPLFLAAALAGVAASTAHALVDFDWSIPATGWVLWALLGAGLGAASATRLVPARPRWEGAGAALLALALLLAILIGQGALHTDRAEAASEASTRPSQYPEDARHYTQEAVDEWRAALNFDPWASDVHRNLGRTLGALGMVSLDGKPDKEMLQEAVQHLVAATRLAPTTAINYYHLGLLQMRTGDTGQAISSFEQALYWDPHNTFSLRQLGSINENTHFEETLRIAGKLVAIEHSAYARLQPLGKTEYVDPNYAFAHVWLGRDKDAKGDPKDALAEYQAAQKIMDDFRRSLQGQGDRDPDLSVLEGRIRKRLAEGLSKEKASPRKQDHEELDAR